MAVKIGVRHGATSGLLALALVGCGGEGLSDGSFVSGSTGVLGAGEVLFVADADNGALARVNVASGDVTNLVLGAEPARIARIGDRLYVTVRAQRSVAVVDVAADGSMELVELVEVGAEPFGIVASPDGKSLFVALSMEDAVVRLEVGSMSEAQRYPVADQPRWLAITPNGRYLYVGSAMRGTFTQIAVKSGESRRVEAPPIERGVPDSGEIVPTITRVTGDPTISDDGVALAVPVLYIDTETSVGPADPETNGGGGGELPPDGGGGGYASGNVEGLTRFNPAVVTFPLDGGGAVKAEGAVAMLVSGQVDLDGLFTEPTFQEFDELGREGDMAEPSFDTGFGRGGQVDSGRFTRVRGYLSGLTFSADGRVLLASVEGGRAIVAMAAEPVTPGEPGRGDFDEDPFFGDGAFEATQRVFIGTDDGPQGIARLDDGRIATFSFMGRSVSAAKYEDIERSIEALALGKTFSTISWTAARVAALPPSILAPDVQEGRRLFFSSSDSAMAAAGAGVSCATCHFDGRNDGVTWTFDHGVRQTPSLAGKVSATAPITWTNSVSTVEEEVRITSQGRMGGHGLTALQALDVGAFIDFTRRVDVRESSFDDAALARGKAIFERADTACASCHAGERFTDNHSYDMVGERGVNTPGLLGVKATAPYFHDGRALTLADVVELADEVGMGHTSQLSAAEKADLVLYMKSL